MSPQKRSVRLRSRARFFGIFGRRRSRFARRWFEVTFWREEEGLFPYAFGDCTDREAFCDLRLWRFDLQGGRRGGSSHEGEVTGWHASAVGNFISDIGSVAYAKITEPRSRREQEGMLTHGFVAQFCEGGVTTRGSIILKSKWANRLRRDLSRGKSGDERKTTESSRLGRMTHAKALADNILARAPRRYRRCEVRLVLAHGDRRSGRSWKRVEMEDAAGDQGVKQMCKEAQEGDM